MTTNDASSSPRKAPMLDFCIIGAMKSGTTSLFDALLPHPQLCLPAKEIHWFSRDFEKRSQADYDAGFSPASGQLVGEASTSYTMRPEFMGVPERMFAYNPAMKLIYLVRNPIDRIESHLAHRALQLTPSAGPFDADLLGRSCYRYQIDPFLELFPADQVLIIGFEQMRADVEGTLRAVTDFLGIPFHGVTTLPHKNSSRVETASMRKRFRKPFKAMPLFARRHLRRFLMRRGSFTEEAPRPEVDAELRRELWDLLIGDVIRLNEIAPNVVQPWLSDPSFPADHLAQISEGAAHLRLHLEVAVAPPAGGATPPGRADRPQPALSA